jgi:hypothetical protein
MSLTTLRIAMGLALVAALGSGFFMAYSLMFIAAAMRFFRIPPPKAVLFEGREGCRS